MSEELGKTIIHEGQFLRFAKRGHWEFAERVGVTGIVAITALTDDGKLLLEEQHRPPVQAECLELPAGLVGDDGDAEETLEAAARRELLEETGYEARHWTFLTEGPPSPGFGTEIVSFFLATGLKKIEEGGGIGGEKITVHEVLLEEVPAWIESRRQNGIMVDPKIYIGLYFAMRYVAVNLGR